jgi:hypothetical protein
MAKISASAAAKTAALKENDARLWRRKLAWHRGASSALARRLGGAWLAANVIGVVAAKINHVAYQWLWPLSWPACLS